MTDTVPQQLLMLKALLRQKMKPEIRLRSLQKERKPSVLPAEC